MGKKKKYLPDILIVLGLILLVFCACQPWGRKWDEKTTEMVSGDEGIYSPDTDSYYYFRKAKEFTEKGITSIRIMSSRAEDPLSPFHQGEESDTMPMLLSALAALLWFALKAMGIHVGIYSLCTNFCGFLLALCTVPLYCFLRKRVSRAAAAFGALAGTLAPAYLHHSLRGYFDTDGIIGLLALGLVLSFYDCVLLKERKRQIAYLLVAFLSMVFLAMTWKVFHVYVFIAIGTGLAAVIIVRVLFTKKEERSIEIRIPLAAAGVLLGGALIIGFKDFLVVLKGMIVSTGKINAWPPTYQNVSEMVRPGLVEAASFWEIFMTTSLDYVSYVGGIFMAVFLVASIVLCVIRFINLNKERPSEYERTMVTYVAVILWFLGTLVMSAIGIRFVEFLILPIALIVAFGFDIVAKYLTSGKMSITVKRILYICAAFAVFLILALMFPVLAVVLAGLILVCGFFLARFEKGGALIGVLFLVLLLGNITGAYLRAGALFPIVEKPTVDAMSWLRANTEENAVIADYWSWGYLYQYFAGRRPLDDGGTYSGEASYWLATMFYTDDLKLSAGIARMLQGGSIEGIDYAVRLCGGEQEATAFLKEILPKSRSEAEEYLTQKYTFSTEEKVKLLDYTHPLNCPDIYLVTSYNTLRVSASMSTISRWDFAGKSPSPVSTLFSQQSILAPKEGETVSCYLWGRGVSDGWRVHYTVKEGNAVAKIESPDGNKYDLPRMVYYKDGGVVYDRTQSAPENGFGFADRQALIIVEERGRLSAIMVDETIVDATLVRLYVLDDMNQNVFEKVYEAEIPEMVSKESSRIQRKLGTENTRRYNQCGVVVWKVHFE